MARNKPTKPLTEAPPEPESSSDHDDPSSGSSTEADEPNTAEPEVSSAASSTEEDEDDGEEEEEQTPTPPSAFTSTSKKPTTAAVTTTKKPPSSSEEESSSDEDNDAPVAELKSTTTTATKPSTEPFSSPKPRSKPAVAAVSSDKRPTEKNEKEKPSSKRAKKDDKSPLSPGPGTEEGSRKLFQRVFSEEDETEILKGLIEFKERKGGDPLKNVDEALGFVKKRVHVEVNKNQMVDKLRRLKRKFATAGRKKFMTDHDKKLFELSKKIWDEDDDGEVKVNDNINGGGVIVKENKNVGGGGGKSGSKNRNLKSGKGENLTATTIQNGPIADYNGVVSVEEGKKKIKEESEGDGMDEDFRVGEGEVEEVMRTEALKRMGEKGRAEIREIWRKVEIAQMEVDVMRSEARVEEKRRILEALGFAKR